MTTPAVLEAVPIPEPDTASLDKAAKLLEQALGVGPADANVAYMLALARKRQGKIGDARTALRKIANPDANVVLQMGLLSFEENQFAQAEQEFNRAWQMDPTSYAAGYNLMLALLCQGKVQGCAPLVGQLMPLATTDGERQFLGLLAPLLERCKDTGTDKPPPLPTDKLNGELAHGALAVMSAADEQRLLQILMGLGQAEAVFPLLRGLAQARPDSQQAQDAFAAAVLLQAKKLGERCQWEAAERLLAPLAASFTGNNPACRSISQSSQIAAYNLLGCCQCMLQEFDRGLDYFSWAIKLSPSDPWLHQNVALAWELRGQIDQADGPWNRYFELQNRVPAPPTANYRDNLAYEGLNRLADAFSKKERWNTALTYLQRACRLRPGDFDSLERLFHMYNQVKRPEDARRTLKRLRELRPNDPQMELYELDLREVKTLEDIDRMLGDIRKTLNKYPGDARVEDKGVAMVGNVIPLIGRMCDQYTDQLSRVMEQVRRLPNYQINWGAVDDVLRDLQREFQKLRKIANKCMTLVTNEEHRRIIRDLTAHIDQKIDLCQGRGR
ncbi:MAG TPA: hypothetical protein VE988_01690 [Gemmataceae bacterium]|nr:hypothetical protein [Gemmataceae bacterium]